MTLKSILYSEALRGGEPMKKQIFLVSLLVSSLLAGCSQVVDEKIEEVSSMTIGEAVEKGADAVKAGWEISKDMVTLIQSNEDAIYYVKDVMLASLPLVGVYVELNTLYADPDLYDVSQWLSIYERNSNQIIEARDRLNELTPPNELQNFHDSYVGVLNNTITVNEKIAQTVEETGEVPQKLLNQYLQIQSEFDAIYQEIQGVQNMLEQN